MIRPKLISEKELSELRKAFPNLNREVNGKPLIYLDSAASAMKCQRVLDATAEFYGHYYSNIHRGVHTLSQEATESYEDARREVARFLDAESSQTIVFTRGTTEGINLVASSWAAPRMKAGDRVLITAMEHHANIVPWQLLEMRQGIEIDVVNVLADGTLDLEDFRLKLARRPTLLALLHVSNALGTINPVKAMIAEARTAGVPVLLDAAQSVPHGDVSVKDLDCDFLVFSGHKLFGPTGIGVLYGKPELLNDTLPYQGGGDMIREVHFSGTTFKEPPERFEAGTPNIAGTIGLKAAIQYLDTLDRGELVAHENALLEIAEAGIGEIPGVQIYGTAKEKASVLSFTMDGIHPHDIGSFLDAEGIAIRTGHHCAQPLMDHFKISGTARASMAFYNTPAEVEVFLRTLSKIQKFFG